MKKKGFTLIELLAVIIILAVIALIATPVVLNVVEDAKRKANKNSAYGLIDGAKLYYTESLLDSSKEENINGTTNLIEKIKVSGRKPDDGEIYINNKGETAIAVVYDNVCYKKNFTESDLTESEDVESCNINVEETPVTPLAYYAFGTPTTSSPTDYQSVITESGSNTFVKLEGEQLSVCIYKNNTLECFKNNNYAEESVHVQNVFGAGTCHSYSSSVSCSDDVFDCYVYSDGNVSCYDDPSVHYCDVSAVGSVECD